jgi:hypothetical protein
MDPASLFPPPRTGRGDGGWWAAHDERPGSARGSVADPRAPAAEAFPPSGSVKLQVGTLDVELFGDSTLDADSARVAVALLQVHLVQLPNALSRGGVEVARMLDVRARSASADRVRRRSGGQTISHNVLRFPEAALDMVTTASSTRADLVQVQHFKTSWAGPIHVSTDIVDFETLNDVVATLAGELGGARGHASNDLGFDDVGPTSRAGAGSRMRSPRRAHNRASRRGEKVRKAYVIRNPGRDFVLEPQIDVLRGATPSVDWVLDKLGVKRSAVLKYTHEIVTVHLEAVLRATQGISGLMESRFCPASIEGCEAEVAEEEAAQARRAAAAARSAFPAQAHGSRRASAPAFVGGSRLAYTNRGTDAHGIYKKKRN